jgi:hypothetical protein
MWRKSRNNCSDSECGEELVGGVAAEFIERYKK